LHKTAIAAIAPAVLALTVAGCGGSTKSPHATASQPPATSAASTSAPASASPYGQPAATTPSANATRAALITTKHHGKLGTVLAFGPKKLTVYLFEGDKGSASSCTGACAGVWPPVTGKPQAAAGAMGADLGTITRSDGITQVTYKGHPLYTYVRDKDDGDAYGEAIKSFGAEWYALSPAGKKIDVS